MLPRMFDTVPAGQRAFQHPESCGTAACGSHSRHCLSVTGGAEGQHKEGYLSGQSRVVKMPWFNIYLLYLEVHAETNVSAY